VTEIIEIVLLSVGAGIIVLCALGVLLVDDPFTQLHFLAPSSTLAVPLISVALMIDQGHNRVSVKIAVITVLLAVTQPAVTAATMRAMADARGLINVRDSG
jgi:multisubunit Na+/H+ antiporter MnhG subunit